MWVLDGGKCNASLFCNSNYETSFFFNMVGEKRKGIEDKPFVFF